MNTLRINGGWRQFTEPLAEREDFDTGGALRGRRRAARAAAARRARLRSR